MKTEKIILWSNDYFNIIEKKYKDAVMTGIEPHLENVVILPYIIDHNMNLYKIGIMNECNPLRPNNFWDTAITGGVEEDETYLEAAKRELLEETGYDINDDNKWTYLGKLFASKSVDMEHPCFCVDITDIIPNKKTGDGSANEKLSTFRLIDPNEIINKEDCFILSLFLKLYLVKFAYNILKK